MLLCKILRCKAVIGKFLLFSSLKIFLNFVSYLLGFLFNLNVCGIYAALKFLTVQCYALSYLALLCFKFPRIRHVFIVVKVTLKWPSVWYISGMNQGKMKRASRGGKLFQCHFVHQKFHEWPGIESVFICDWRMKLTVLIRKDQILPHRKQSVSPLEINADGIQYLGKFLKC